MRVTRTTRDFQNALLVLLEKNSFDHLTVDRICQEALLHRSSFYRYFNDKYDLLEQTINAQISQIADNNDESQADIVENLLSYINEHKNIIRHLAASGTHSSLYSELLKILTKIMLERSQHNSNDGLIIALQNSDNPKMLAYTISGALMGSFYWWQENNYDVSLDEVIKFTKKVVQAVSNSQKL